MVRQSPDFKDSLYALIACHLRFQRIKRKMTQTQLGQIIGCTKSQVSKYELNSKQLDEQQCEALDTVWNTGGLFSHLLYYAKLGVDPNWPEALSRYQRTSVVLRLYYNNVVPMPFQTEDYARSLLEVGHAAGLLDDVDVAVAKRMGHQAAMLEGNPMIWAVLEDVALRPMGSTTVMQGQRDRLLELAALHNVSVRVLPGNATPHIGVDGSFSCFELRDGHRAAFAGTNLDVGRVIEDQTEAANVAVRFERIAARSWNEDQSREWIAGMCA